MSTSQRLLSNAHQHRDGTVAMSIFKPETRPSLAPQRGAEPDRDAEPVVVKSEPLEPPSPSMIMKQLALINFKFAVQSPPVLAVKLQEMFGCEQTPRLVSNAVVVVVHLLSPAGRPLQITQDLAGFWRSSYHQVRKEMNGRYPKHPWPENPLQALPTRRTKPR